MLYLLMSLHLNMISLAGTVDGHSQDELEEAAQVPLVTLHHLEQFCHPSGLPSCPFWFSVKPPYDWTLFISGRGNWDSCIPTTSLR